uniref:Uncharacterized protein n=1 Tax=Fagus sylvatica TaxID=28930 RepID=A0A2N9H3K7_FAGSY
MPRPGLAVPDPNGLEVTRADLGLDERDPRHGLGLPSPIPTVWRSPVPISAWTRETHATAWACRPRSQRTCRPRSQLFELKYAIVEIPVPRARVSKLRFAIFCGSDSSIRMKKRKGHRKWSRPGGGGAVPFGG